MKAKDVIQMAGIIEKEGFESAFVDYSDFKDIQDAEFHEKRKAYLDSRKALVEYLGLEDQVSM